MSDLLLLARNLVADHLAQFTCLPPSSDLQALSLLFNHISYFNTSHCNSWAPGRPLLGCNIPTIQQILALFLYCLDALLQPPAHHSIQCVYVKFRSTSLSCSTAALETWPPSGTMSTRPIVDLVLGWSSVQTCLPQVFLKVIGIFCQVEQGRVCQPLVVGSTYLPDFQRLHASSQERVYRAWAGGVQAS